MGEIVTSIESLSGIASLIGLLITIATIAYKFGVMNDRLNVMWDVYKAGLYDNAAKAGIGERGSEIEITEKGESLLSDTMKKKITKMVKKRKGALRMRFVLQRQQSQRISKEYGYAIINEMMDDITERAHKENMDIQLLIPAVLLYAEKVEKVEEGKQKLLSGDSSKIESLVKEMSDSEKQQYLDRAILILKEEDKSVHWKAAEWLGVIKDAKAVDPLIEALKDRNEKDGARWEVAAALGNIPEAVDQLIKVLKDENEEAKAREYAANALGNIGNAKGVDPLIEALKDKNNDGVRMNAAKALGKICDVNDVKAVEALKEAQKDGIEAVRENAREACEKIEAKQKSK